MIEKFFLLSAQVGQSGVENLLSLRQVSVYVVRSKLSFLLL